MLRIFNRIRLLGAALVVATVGLGWATPAHAAEMLVNGDFETGSFAPWVDNATGTSGCGQDWDVTTNTCPCDCVPGGIQSGTYSAITAFDGDGPVHYRITQDFTVPNLPISATLSWYQAGSLDVGGAPRVFTVEITDLSDTSLAVIHTESFSGSVYINWMQQVHNISSVIASLAGQTVRLAFDAYVSENYSGPAAFGIDSVSLDISYIDLDADGDGVVDTIDNCPLVANPAQTDSDGDGLGDACDAVDDLDVDGDGVVNAADNCPFVANAGQEDADNDGLGDACDGQNGLDLDGDGVLNTVDNCPFAANAGQEDADADGVGDACDGTDGLDVDGDGVENTVDNCPFVANAGQEDADDDGVGDACDTQDGSDLDGDGVENTVDNCPFVANAGQEDVDNDGLGDACDGQNGLDLDGDGVENTADNCPFVANAGQEDADNDGFGDACDNIVDTSDGGGCGCRQSEGVPGSAVPIFLLLLGLWIVRRRRT